MQSKAATVEQYLSELPADRRAALEALRAVFRRNLDPDYEEGMQYGMVGYYVPHRIYPAGYHCDPRQPLPFAGMASQKNHMSLYMMCVYGGSEHEKWFRDAWAKTGKKLDMGKACVRFKKLDDLALEVVGEAIRRVPVRKYIEYYENSLRSMDKRASKGATQSEGPAKPAGSAKGSPKSAKAKRKNSPARSARPAKSTKARKSR